MARVLCPTKSKLLAATSSSRAKAIPKKAAPQQSTNNSREREPKKMGQYSNMAKAQSSLSNTKKLGAPSLKSKVAQIQATGGATSRTKPTSSLQPSGEKRVSSKDTLVEPFSSPRKSRQIDRPEQLASRQKSDNTMVPEKQHDVEEVAEAYIRVAPDKDESLVDHFLEQPSEEASI